MRRDRAFTLAELITVIGVIALLAMVLMPHLQSSYGVARSRLCANNLRRICEACQTWATEGENWRLNPLAESGWTSVVSRYASSTCLRCPEGGELSEGTPVEDQLVIRTSPTSNVGIPLVPLMEGGGFKVLKLSQTQWDSGIGESARYDPVPYEEDGNPNVYWWGYDDGAIGRGDYDFQDLAIKVTKKGDGTAEIYVISTTAGKPEVWDRDFSECFAKWQEINQHINRSVKGVTFTLNVGGGSHYGMNQARMDMRLGGKLMALDYQVTTAQSTDDWDNPEWDVDEDGRPDFLRHRGQLNIVTLDGSVTTRTRREVDPVDPEVERLLWQRR